jgi:hypothetical protein
VLNLLRAILIYYQNIRAIPRAYIFKSTFESCLRGWLEPNLNVLPPSHARKWGINYWDGTSLRNAAVSSKFGCYERYMRARDVYTGGHNVGGWRRTHKRYANSAALSQSARGRTCTSRRRWMPGHDLFLSSSSLTLQQRLRVAEFIQNRFMEMDVHARRKRAEQGWVPRALRRFLDA